MAANQIQAEHTATQVIEMFQGLDLLVTNDEQIINQRYADAKERFTNQKKSTDGQQRVIADNWFKNGRLLRKQKHREELIRIVYAQFEDLADTALEGNLSQDNNELTQALVDSLARIARNSCQCDDQLVRQFVNTYLSSNNLSLGQALIQPRLVSDLHVSNTKERVNLTWDLPLQGCEYVQIRRQELDTDGTPLDQPEIVFDGSTDAYEDQRVLIGATYRYDVHSVLYNKISEACVSTRPAIVTGDISEFQPPEWSGDHVRLNWKKPSDNCTVYLFRSTTGKIELHPGTAEPQTNADLLYKGPATTYADDRIQLGQRYEYLAVAFFGPNSYSSGTPRSITTPLPPSDVEHVHVDYKDKTVEVTWPAVASAHPVEYYVVRTEGTQRASSVDPPRGKTVGPLKETTYYDNKAQNGQQYVYTLFAKCQGLYSQRGAASDPYVVMDEVTDIIKEESHTAVTLRWATPPEAETVVVRRSLSKIGPGNAGVEVPLTGPNIAQDTDLRNDQQYHYNIACVYKLDSGQRVVSAGVPEEAVPRPWPGEITAFEVEHDRNYIVSIFEAMGPGTVVIVRTNKEPALKPDTMIRLSELREFGHQLATADNRAIDREPTAAEPFYVPFIVSGHNARIGPALKCMVFEDVSDLTLERLPDGIQLKWTWPTTCECRSVMVVRRYGDWPTGIDDPEATRKVYSKVQYHDNSDSYVDTGLQPGRVYYVVYAQPYEASERVYSPGLAPGCRSSIETFNYGKLRYSLDVHRPRRIIEPYPPRVPKSKANRLDWRIRRAFRAIGMAIKLSLFGHEEIRLQWEFDEVPDQFSGFVLVAARLKPPSDKESGVTLFEWVPDDITEYEPGDMELESIPLSRQDREKLTDEFYCRIFYINPAEAERVVPIHPDYSVPLLMSGGSKT